jgi:hypothetical protein
MGVLEYRHMPTLSEAGHEGWFCTFTILQQLKITLAIQVSSSCTKKPSDTGHPSRTKPHLVGHSPTASQGKLPCWTSPLVFGLIALYSAGSCGAYVKF